MEPFVGQICIFGFNFAPKGWALCNGQLLSISSYTALFSLLGTYYGGDGQTTFGLPNLQGRVPIHFGSGPGLSPYDLGQVGGSETVTLTPAMVPPHGHGVAASSGAAATPRPGGGVLAAGGSYASAPDGTSMSSAMIEASGGGGPHPNIQPFVVVNFCIALEGIYPSRS